jgi:TonB family protein
VRPELKACYREGKKKEPNLEGTVRIAIEVDTLGKVKTTKIVEKTLPDKVAQCMLKAVKAAPKTELSEKCPGKSLTIPVTFPTP